MTSTGTATNTPAQTARQVPRRRGCRGLCWGISALFYLAVFFLRAAPAVLTSELMRDFGIGAASLG